MEENFKILKLNIEDALRLEKEANEVHYHDYEELIVGVDGKLEHFIDFKSTEIVAPFISFVSKGKVHRVQASSVDNKFEIYVIRFKSEFIAETTFQLYAHYHDKANIILEKDRCFKRLPMLCEMMYHEALQDEPDYAVVRQLLSTLFSMIESERRKLEPEEKEVGLKTQSITFKNFLKILEENFRRPEGVEFYAEKLFMSSRNLNMICHQILQQSVSEIIETRKLLEAKNLLISTDKTISEIGFELGYNEKAYFTNVFKRKAGQTPSEFREEMKKLVS